MSQHRHKPPKSGPRFMRPRANKRDVELAREVELTKMAGLIKNQQQLDAIMLQMRPEIRQRGLDRMRPFLPFQARETAPTEV